MEDEQALKGGEEEEEEEAPQESEVSEEENTPDEGDVRESLAELYEVLTSETEEGLTWEGMREELGHNADISWDDLELDRTFIPLRVWLTAEVLTEVAPSQEEFVATLASSATAIESEILKAVQIFRYVDIHGNEILKKSDLEDGLDGGGFAWLTLGFSSIISAKYTLLALGKEDDRKITFEDFFNLLLHFGGKRVAKQRSGRSTEDMLRAVRGWNPDDVADWLSEIGYPQYSEVFLTNRFDGKKLLNLPAHYLPKLGVQQWDHIKDILKQIKRLKGLILAEDE